ncbi:P-loop containing nucleoside triphosphate hydrolase protein [Sporodiniella umbellata]|nr:P-loop containing nucleoside triphosphate hydrolase protein [Sporodiniella umbellata]
MEREGAVEQLAKSLGVYEKLEEEGFESPEEILPRSASDLQRLLKVDASAVEDLFDAAAIEAYDWRLREQTGKQLVETEPNNILTTGDDTFDAILGGGIPLGTITEIVGESSSGKTQLGVQLCLSVQKRALEGGLEGSAVYIHSEGPFPSIRLDQLVDKYVEDAPGVSADDLRNHIHTIRVTDGESQFRVLAYQLPAFLETQHQNSRKVRLVVIDSISAIYRGDSSYKKGFDKMTEICEIGTRLKKLASKYNVAIVAINQVADVPEDSSKGSGSTDSRIEEWLDFNLVNNQDSHQLGLFIQSLLKKPVLGLPWQNSVNTRIRLARSQMMSSLPTKRVFFLEFSPKSIRTGCETIISESGIHAVLPE